MRVLCSQNECLLLTYVCICVPLEQPERLVETIDRVRRAVRRYSKANNQTLDETFSSIDRYVRHTRTPALSTAVPCTPSQSAPTALLPLMLQFVSCVVYFAGL